MRNRARYKKINIYYFYALLLAIVAVGEYSIYATLRYTEIFTSGLVMSIFIASLIIIPLIFIITSHIGYDKYSRINSILYTISATWLGLMIYLLLAILIIILCISLNNFLGLKLPIHDISILTALSAVIITIYGVINSSRPRKKKLVIESSALRGAWSGKKIIVISDTHFGQVRGEKFSKKIIALIKRENPDIVFHAGDIIDGPAIPYEKFFAPFKTLLPPLGTVYTQGNHELYSQEYDVFRQHFPPSITDATDKKISINNTQIFGLSFHPESLEDTKSRLMALGYDKNVPSIVLLHDPKNAQALADIGVSLVLSGHTHAGQFPPVTWITKSINGPYNYGLNMEGETAMLTTCGIGTAMMPLRIGTTPEIVVLDIK